MRLLSVLLAACSAGLLLTGCGSGRAATPKIDRATAQQLARESDAIAGAPDECDAAHRADQLKLDVEQAIADGHVPAALRPELRANVTNLVDDLNCPTPPREEDHGKGKHKKKGKGEGD